MWKEGESRSPGWRTFLTFDDTSLELILESLVEGKPVPFQQGGWIQGEVYNNETLGDGIANGLANGVSGFQLYYFGNSRASFVGPQRVATGRGYWPGFGFGRSGRSKILWRSFGWKKPPPNEIQTAYFVREDPGRTYQFHAVRKLRVDRGPVGDFEGNVRVDFRDFFSFRSHFGLSQGAVWFDPVDDLWMEMERSDSEISSSLPAILTGADGGSFPLRR